MSKHKKDLEERCIAIIIQLADKGSNLWREENLETSYPELSN